MYCTVLLSKAASARSDAAVAPITSVRAAARSVSLSVQHAGAAEENDRQQATRIQIAFSVTTVTVTECCGKLKIVWTSVGRRQCRIRATVELFPTYYKT